jgi:predicted transcriptional regulator
MTNQTEVSSIEPTDIEKINARLQRLEIATQGISDNQEEMTKLLTHLFDRMKAAENRINQI